MAFSTASTQLAAFHQPVEVHKPLALYHCCRVEMAVTVLALKSSPGTSALQLAANANRQMRNEILFTKPGSFCMTLCGMDGLNQFAQAPTATHSPPRANCGHKDARKHAPEASPNSVFHLFPSLTALRSSIMDGLPAG